jgi:Bacterial TniB protein.
MKLLKLVFILMAVVVSPAFAEEPKPLGVALGAPLEEVWQVLGNPPFRETGINAYTSGPMYVLDGYGLGISDLQSVLLVFDADRRLAGLKMTMHGGGLGKENFDRVLAYLKERYKVIHALPGTTFSNVQELKEARPEKGAVMTFREFERWFATWVVKVYHQRLHKGLASPVDKRSIYLNTLKHLSNELELPIALIGTIEAVRAIQTDQQLGNRFEPLLVPRWKLDSEYATFLSDLAGALGVGGNFGSRELVKKLHSLSEGLTGETWKLLVWAAQKLMPIGADIDVALLEKVPWQRPSERRRLG